ncbi:NUDIX domain-containing protein [Pseudochryseolinea flava]|uniref:ADP-ribose pyrophosphatase n=1 Tax=Pseudochryseolinea flava TaxID=2059302 RepID=A0A364XWZ1_9BACT|nr:NUDIX domain-containing protein [Pseudochryseolinea flava]RAV98938.1 ADP-ribose pyrophosphatase [Pseudochryseolinea flava]
MAASGKHILKFCPKCGKPLVSKSIEGKSRLCCADNDCGYIFWNNPIPVVAMIVETSQGIVLAHNKLAPKGMYSVITGFLESAESPEEAAIRETKEELGLDTDQITFIGMYPFVKTNQLLIAYHIMASGEVMINDELDDFKVVQKDVLHGWRDTNRFEVAQWLQRLSVLADGVSLL